MLYRFAVLALLLGVLAVQTRGEVGSARNFYYLAQLVEASRHESRSIVPRCESETRIVHIDRSELARMLEPTVLARQARIVPATTESGARGLRTYAVRPGSLFEALGIRNGDTLLSIDGHALATRPSSIELYEPLTARDFVDLELDRAGRSVRIVVLIQG